MSAPAAGQCLLELCGAHVSVAQRHRGFGLSFFVLFVWCFCFLFFWLSFFWGGGPGVRFDLFDGLRFFMGFLEVVKCFFPLVYSI